MTFQSKSIRTVAIQLVSLLTGKNISALERNRCCIQSPMLNFSYTGVYTFWRIIYSYCYCDRRPFFFFLFPTKHCWYPLAFRYVTGRHGNLVWCQSDALMRESEESEKKMNRERKVAIFIYFLSFFFYFSFGSVFSSSFLRLLFQQPAGNNGAGTSCKHSKYACILQGFFLVTLHFFFPLSFSLCLFLIWFYTSFWHIDSCISEAFLPQSMHLSSSLSNWYPCQSPSRVFFGVFCHFSIARRRSSSVVVNRVSHLAHQLQPSRRVNNQYWNK